MYVTTKSEDLGRVTTAIQNIVNTVPHAANMRVNLRGMVLGMQQSFRSFAIGLTLSFLLLYLILVAQFKSFVDPLLIMLAIPMGLIGVLVILVVTGTTLNVMSLMGVLMLVGIAASNSILSDFACRLRGGWTEVKDAVTSCRVRLRPILMTSLATIIGMILDGAQAGHRRRAVCSHGPNHYWRLDRLGTFHDIHRPGGLSVDLPPLRDGAVPCVEPANSNRLICPPFPFATRTSSSSFA